MPEGHLDHARPTPTWHVTVRPPARRPDVDHPEVVAAHMWRLGARAVVDHGGTIEGQFAAPVEVPAAWAGWEVATRVEPATDHMAAWRAGARSVRAGRFLVVPSHLADAAGPGDDPGGTGGVDTIDGADLRIVLDAGMAFGSGHHETTAGCLAALDDVPVAGRRIADVGTGTGVLAIAAAMLDADRVVAVDVDPTAVAVARDNIRANDVEVEVTRGGTDVLAGRFDGVLANLLTGSLVDLAADLHDCLVPGGWLVASGASLLRVDRVVDALGTAGLADVDVRPGREWAVVVAHRPV